MNKEWDESTLSSLRIHELRDLARKIGVKCPTALKKEDLVSQSMQISNVLFAGMVLFTATILVIALGLPKTIVFAKPLI